MTGLVRWCLDALSIFFRIFQKDPEPVYGVYSQPGKWYPFKLAIFYITYCFRQWRAAPQSKNAGYGVKSRASPEEMDRLQPLSSHPKAFDAVFFMGANESGYYMAISSERRRNGHVYGIFYLQIPGLGLLKCPNLPDTHLIGDVDPDFFGAEGIRLKPLEAMKKWEVGYSGKAVLIGDSGQREVVVKLESEWSSNFSHFDYDSDMNPWTVSRAFAREKWSKEYFNSLREAHQTHYEQIGELKGSVHIDDEIYSVEIPCFRDHSYGEKRDWKLMHRYAFHTIFLKNGLSAVVGVVCQPCTCSRLELGFVCMPNGDLQPVSWCDLNLEYHGEGGNPPVDHAFRFRAGGETYLVQVQVKQAPFHYLGEEWEARNVERFVTYRVNNHDGWGVSEWNYRNRTGKQ